MTTQPRYVIVRVTAFCCISFDVLWKFVLLLDRFTPDDSKDAAIPVSYTHLDVYKRQFVENCNEKPRQLNGALIEPSRINDFDGGGYSDLEDRIYLLWIDTICGLSVF